jgi:predicted nucleotidyltransferase
MSVVVDDKAAAECLAGFPGIVAAWVFGSAKGGVVRSNGDIDVALLLDHKPSLDELAAVRAALQDALHFDNIDLVPVNDTSPILRFEAVSGKLIFCRNRLALTAFVSLTAREYESDMAFLQWGMKSRKGGGTSR